LGFTVLPSQISEGDLAKYPFLDEAFEYLKKLEITIEDLLRPENERILNRSFELVLESVKRKFTRKLLPPPWELVAWMLALILLKLLDRRDIASKFAFKESVKIEKFVLEEQSSLRLFLLKRALKIEILESFESFGFRRYDYMIRVPDFLSFASSIRGKGFDLVNKVVSKGYVYLDVGELTRLARAKLYENILKKYDAVKVHAPHPKLEEEASKLRRMLPPPPEPLSERIPIPELYPPCIRSVLGKIESGVSPSHYERFLLATYFFSVGKSTEDLLAVLSRMPDYNERVARYQAEHILGVRGGRKRYSVPSCEHLNLLGLCFRDRMCGGITHPLRYKQPAEGT